MLSVLFVIENLDMMMVILQLIDKCSFWLDQIYPLKAQNIAKLKVKTLQKKTTQLTQSQAQEFSENHVPLLFIITTHS